MKILDVPMMYTIVANDMGMLSVERRKPLNSNKNDATIRMMTIVLKYHLTGSKHHMCHPI